MINPKELLSDLQRLLPRIEDDILGYSESNQQLGEHLRVQYEQVRKAGRTAEHFVTWRQAQITQAAVAWMLTCVFVRFLEDNQLLDEPILAGPVEREDGSQPLQHAKERITAYFNENPTHAERDYLLSLFGQLERFPVIAQLLDHSHNPLWQIRVSADGAKRLVDFYQRIDPETGQLVHNFTDPSWDTRFLGDLYQDLSESVRKRYALLQTPEFVESFILDYTLEKAIDAFGLPEVKLIDPTCGSGHFLLTTFERVFNAWVKREPATNARTLAQRALDVVHGVDINPYAVAICRFRLLIAAMKAAQSTQIKNAPDFRFNLACGDSLLHGPRFEWQGQGLQSHLIDEDPIKHVLEVEDKEKLSKILGQRYQVVVGNPPYITVKDKSLNKAYRVRYPTCHMKYSLGVPFSERFFDLALPDEDERPAGYIGLITANSFMKREFGKKLVEEYLVRKNLTHVIDTSGAYIPGHGTPTVIMFARNSKPSTPVVRAILGVDGEPSTPDNPALGKVWSSIVSLIERPNSQNAYVSSVDQERKVFASHPWSLTGGSAPEVKTAIESASDKKLRDLVASMGVMGISGAGEIMLGPKDSFTRNGVEKELIREMYSGDVIRDWDSEGLEHVLFPYTNEIELDEISSFPGLYRWLWPNRTNLGSRATFGGGTYCSEGRPWWEWHQVTLSRLKSEYTIAYAEVASHNHFILDKGGRVFNQTAPVIKLTNGDDPVEHFSALAVLNSSSACFWMKQVSHQKQMMGGDGVRVSSKAKVPYQFGSTQLKKFPFPRLFSELSFRQSLAYLAETAHGIVSKFRLLSANQIVRDAADNGGDISAEWEKAVAEKSALHEKLVLLQEEADWTLYVAYGLCSGDVIEEFGEYIGQGLRPGQRPFEIVDGVSQDNHVVPDQVPENWPAEMQSVWRRRIDEIKNNRLIAVVEKPLYKRRWIGRQGTFNHSALADELETACKNELLDLLEKTLSETLSGVVTVAQLADRVILDERFQAIGSAYMGAKDFGAQKLVEHLVNAQEVPQMAAARVKPAAIHKYRAWQDVWSKQREEDAIDAEYGLREEMLDKGSPVSSGSLEAEKSLARLEKSEAVGNITPPPPYSATDFRKSSYWTLRGKFDVPKERFFSLPGCEKSGDATLVIGWAGMNHLQRAQAIATWYVDRKESDGWEAEKLMPMLVALDELIPWLKQWHNELDPEYGQRMGDFYEEFLLEELRTLGVARSQLDQWQPAIASRGRRATARSN